jgi:peptide/nickel transport system permease protein
MKNRYFFLLFMSFAQLMAVLLGVVTVLFVLFSVLADPAQQLLGQRSDQQTAEAIRRELGLDRPLWVQYALYLNDLSPIAVLSAEQQATGNYQYWPLYHWSEQPANPALQSALVVKWPYLRRSYQNNQPVATLFREKLPGTALLALSSMVLAVILGIGMAIAAAAYPESWLDSLLTFVASLGISTPSYLAALLLAWLLAVYAHQWTGLPVTGFIWERDMWAEDAETYVWQWETWVLPTLTLAIRPLAVIFQLCRAQMRQVLAQDYIRTARAKGLSERVILWRHALRPALNPVINAIALWFGSLLTGAFFVEYIFNWDGIGKLTIDALLNNDYPLLLGSCIFTALIFTLLLRLSDGVNQWLGAGHG